MKKEKHWTVARGKRKVPGSYQVGLIIFFTMVIFCVGGALLFPLDVTKSNTQLKNLAPSSRYLKVDQDLNPRDVLDIQSTLSYSVALTKDQKLVFWGDTPALDENFKTMEFVQIATGYSHVLALDTKGILHHLGSTEHELAKFPEELADIEIAKLGAGEDCSAVLSTKGELYLWGNMSVFGDEVAKKYQGHIKDMSFGVHHLALVLDSDEVVILGNQGSEIAEVPDFLQEGEMKIKEIALSNDQGAALDVDGNIYLWGKQKELPEVKEPMVKIDASSQLVFTLGESGKVYALGNAQYEENRIPEAETFTSLYADTYQIYGVKEEVHAWGNHGFILGSDRYGRDIFTRLLHGGRITMGIGIVACFMETFLGVLLGLLAGIKGGWIDHMIMRFADIVASIPFLPLLITLSAMLGKEWSNSARMWLIMLLLGLLSWPNLARLLRSAILAEREKDYVWSAKIIGSKTMRLLRKVLLPQVMYLVLINATLSYADAMLIESSLSFLGFGVQAPYPSWGNMLDGAQTTYVLEHCWWQWMLPALCILMVVLSVNMIGEGLRKKLDPRGEIK